MPDMNIYHFFSLKLCILSVATLGYFSKLYLSKKNRQKRGAMLQVNTHAAECPIKSQQLPGTDRSKPSLRSLHFSITDNIFQSMCKSTCPHSHQSVQ